MWLLATICGCKITIYLFIYQTFRQFSLLWEHYLGLRWACKGTNRREIIDFLLKKRAITRLYQRKSLPLQPTLSMISHHYYPPLLPTIITNLYLSLSYSRTTMNNRHHFSKLALAAFTAIQTALPLSAQSASSAKGYPISPVPFTSVKVTPGTFWGQRLEASRNVTIPLAFSKCEESGRYMTFAQAAHPSADY